MRVDPRTSKEAMVRVRIVDGGWIVGIVLLVFVAGSALVVASCGSGGGDNKSNGVLGGLCAQCGATDGPCKDTVEVPEEDRDFFCPNATSDADCPEIALTCFRETDSAQRRCYPSDAQFELFRCDGKRANRNTPTVTATPTLSGTPTVTSTAATPTSTGPTATGVTPTATGLTPTPAATATPVCGNNMVEGDEQCDGTDLDENDCSDLCVTEQPDGVVPACNSNCTYDFSPCTDPSSCSAE